MYACANQGPVSVTFPSGTQILKLNAKEYYYSSQFHLVLLPDGYIERLQDENTEKERTTHDITNRSSGFYIGTGRERGEARRVGKDKDNKIAIIDLQNNNFVFI